MSPSTPPAPLESLTSGLVIDGFRLLTHAHRGGMANLWIVERVDAGDPMPLIMKLPRIKGGDDPTTIVGFEVEQMVLPLLAGPHVPRFIAQGDFTHRPYIVMERIAGESLKSRFDAAPLAVDEVVAIGCAVANALHDLHRQHVVHLDVKPSNVMFRASGEAVLIDFGIAHHDHLPDLLDEEFELPMGTSPYMSPEQVQFVRNDLRSDLFALGVMLYQLTTGQRPFGAPSSVRGLRERLYRDPLPPRALRADCPAWLQEIILRCLEVRPERRHQSAAQLAFDLHDPQQMTLTARAGRIARRGAWPTVRRWFSAVGQEPEAPASAAAQTERHPIVLAAVDVANAEPALLTALAGMVARVLQTSGDVRLACVAVMKIRRIGLDDLVDEDGASVHVNLLVQLKHWARAFADAERPGRELRITFHVLEAVDPANAIVDFARRNQVDQIVIGARSSGSLRRYLGSVSTQVVAEAPCSVSVVRTNVPNGT